MVAVFKVSLKATVNMTSSLFFLYLYSIDLLLYHAGEDINIINMYKNFLLRNKVPSAINLYVLHSLPPPLSLTA